MQQKISSIAARVEGSFGSYKRLQMQPLEKKKKKKSERLRTRKTQREKEKKREKKEENFLQKFSENKADYEGSFSFDWASSEELSVSAQTRE